MKTITKKEKFAVAIEILQNVDLTVLEALGYNETTRTTLIETFTKEIEMLTKKSGGSKKVNAQNEELKKLIIDVMETVGVASTITDLLRDKRLANYIVEKATETKEAKKLSPQKVSALFTQLQKDNIVKRTEQKGKAYFELIKAEAEATDEE